MAKKGWLKTRQVSSSRDIAAEKNPVDIWETILSGPEFGDADWKKHREADPRLLLYGYSAVEQVIARFIAVLGPDAVVESEASFCEATHCPSKELDAWLSKDWNRHHACAVARLEEVAGLFPVLLIRGRGPVFTIEIWSPKDISHMPARAPVEDRPQ